MKKIYRIGAPIAYLCISLNTTSCISARECQVTKAGLAIALAGLSGPVYRTDAEMDLHKSVRKSTTDASIYVLGDGLKYRIVNNESGINTIKMIPTVGYNWPKPIITGGTTINGTTTGAVVTGGTIANGNTTGATTVGGVVTGSVITGATIIGATIIGGATVNGVTTGGTISGGTITAGISTGGTVAGGTTTGGSSTGTLIGGTAVNGVTTGGTTTGATLTTGGPATGIITNSTVVGGTLTGGTTVGGTTVGGTITAGTAAAGTTTGGTITGGTITGATGVGGTAVGGTITGATITGATINGSTVSGGTTTGVTVTGGTVTGGTTTGGTITDGSLTGGMVTNGSRTGMTAAEIYADAKATAARSARASVTSTSHEDVKTKADKAEKEANDAAIVVARANKPAVVYITADYDKDPTAYFEEIEKHETFSVADVDMTQQNKVIVNQVVLAVMVLPIKIRPAREFNGTNYERHFATDVSIGPFIGYRFKFKGNNYKTYTTIGGFAGPTLINYVSTTSQTGKTTTGNNTTIIQTVTPTNGANPDNMIAFTYGVGIVHEINGFQLGIVYGEDRVSGAHVKDWPYDGKGWFSIAIGYNFLANR